MTASRCQKAAWKDHKAKCAPKAPRVPLKDVLVQVAAANNRRDWWGVLEWEGRMEEMMEARKGLAPLVILDTFLQAHSQLCLTGPCIEHFRQHSSSVMRLHGLRIELLGKLQRFRDQGEAMCDLAAAIETSKPRGQRQDVHPVAEKWYQQARDLGAAHGFFTLECRACSGKHYTLIPKSQTLRGYTTHTNPQALNPKPQTLNLEP